MKPSSVAAARTSTCHLFLWATAVGIALAGLVACQQAGAADEVGPSDPHVQLELRPGDHEARPAPPPPGGPRYDTISRDREFHEIDRHDRDHRIERGYGRSDDGRFGPRRTFESSMPQTVILLAVIGFAFFVLRGIRRRRTEAARTGAGAGAAVAVGQPRMIVALACNRCSRVVDVPRDRVVRGLFCPRCGSRMPDRA